MQFTQYLLAFGFLSAAQALDSLDSSPNEDHVLKRSPLLADRATCSIAGWIPACPTGIACVPVGAICCSDGLHYVMPPNKCRSGTTPVATASITDSAPTITPAPTLPPAAPVLTTYTYTITWYYFYYYYYYIAATTHLTSYTITTQSTIFISATDSAAALASFKAVSATATFATPTQGVTSVSGTPAPTTIKSSTTASLTPTASSNATVTKEPVPTYSQVPVGAAASLRAGNGWGVAVFGVLAFVPVILLVWL